MRRFAMAITLAFALSSSGLAGDIPTSDVVPPSPGSAPTANAAAPGDVPSTDSAQPISDAALSFIQAMVGLLI